MNTVSKSLNNHVKNKSSRAKTESTRAKNKSSRAKTESTRAKNKSSRAKTESSRAKTESSRAKNKSTRAKNKSTRAKTESSPFSGFISQVNRVNWIKVAVFTIFFTFITTFSVESFAQECTKPEGQIVAAPVFVYDKSADSMIITVTVKNTGTAAFAAPFKITVYKNDVGDAKRHTCDYNSVIAAGETVDVTFGVKKFKTEWTPFDTIKIRINDSGNGYNNQPVCDSARRDHKSVQLIASDDYVLIFNNSADNQFRVVLNDLLPASYVSLTVNVLNDPVYTGTATVGGSTIFYTPATGKTADTVRYRIHCGNAEYADTATIYIKIMEKPDNMGDAECFVIPTPLPWSISAYHSFTGVNSMSTPLVADLDGNGAPEVIAPQISTNVGDPWRSGGLIVGNVTAKTQRTITTVQFATHGQSIAIANVNANPSVNKDAYIFILGIDYKIYCYNGNTGALATSWGSSGSVDPQSALAAADKRRYIIQLADINADGIPELVAGPYIYNARTGVLLLAGAFQLNGTGFGSPHGIREANWGRYRMPAIGDIDSDGQLEIAAGNAIYKPVITNAASSSGNTWTVLRTAAANAAVQYPDGQTVLVDFDRDGDLDVAVVGCEIRDNVDNVETYYVQFYVWDGQTSNIVSYAPVLPNRTLATIPYAGDLDGDKFIDFAFAENSNGLGLVSYHYDPTQPGNLKRGLNKPEFAETAGFTMFDFNQDGKSEIVYRNTSQFFIIDGTTLNPITPITTMYSGTVAEYPIVADADNDGSAEIILTHANKAWSTGDATGTMTVYKSGNNDAKWAPARKVWNQWHYNTTLINEDMTVRRYPVNPATVFPGLDGQLGTNDDIQPYNAFLQQQTTLSKNGTPYWEASDYAIEGIPNAVYYPADDSLSISFCVKNYGDIQGTAPFHVAIYKNERKAANKILTKSFSNIPAPGQTVCNYSLKVENVLATGGLNTLHLWLNDEGGGASVNPECDYTNGVVIYDITGDVAAENDYASIFECDAVSIPILANDDYSGTTFKILNTPKYGTVSQSGGVLKYTNNASGTSGLPCEQSGNRTDTIRYKIESLVSPAEAYAVVKIYNPPDMILENACSINPKLVLNNSYDGFSYDWEHSLDGASGWTLVADDGGTELNNVKAGFYRVTINYDNNRKYQLKTGVKVVEKLKTTLPGEIVWYEMSSNSININWQ